MSLNLSEQEIVRRDALQKLREMGIDPYPAEQVQRTHYSNEIKKRFEQGEQLKEVRLNGRLMAKRIMGKASFAELQDALGRIQLYFNRDDISPGEDKSMYNEVFKKLLDIGDFISVEGYVFRTQMGEISVHVTSFKVLSKSLRPLPIVKTDASGNTHDAFTDPEQRYRQRYVDLIVNDRVRETFMTRTRIVNAMREYFNKDGYMEVETPILQPIPGGAAARPFVTHHNALDIPLYLRIANELYLKRLIVGGYEGVYEFAKDFRNEGMDRTHNPEFTVLEIYVAYKDYFWMMDYTEKMLEHVVRTINAGSTRVRLGNMDIDFKAPFPRIKLLDAIKAHTGYDLRGKEEEEIRNIAESLGIETNPTMGKGKLIDEIFGEKCESNFIQPTFIVDYPIEMSPLCKKHRNDSTLTERFELYVNGKEVANAYSELNDPIDQRERFEEQLKLSEKGDDEAMFIDQDFLRALEYGMPPTSGMGIGIDRLTMMLTNQPSIQEVLFFPQMKPLKRAKDSGKSDFIKLGIPEDWAEVILQSGLSNPKELFELKPTQLHQTLNGIRKKKKLNIPALQLSEVEGWFKAKL